MPLFLPSYVSWRNVVLAVPIHECLGKHSCMSSTFPIAILNGTCFSPTVQFTMCIRREKVFYPAPPPPVNTGRTVTVCAGLGSEVIHKLLQGVVTPTMGMLPRLVIFLELFILSPFYLFLHCLVLVCVLSALFHSCPRRRCGDNTRPWINFVYPFWTDFFFLWGNGENI